jgi:tape measure domain-containing protein
MAKAIDTLSIKLDFKAGSGSQQIIDKIGNSIKNLKVIAGQTGPSVEKVRRSINDFANQGNRSISTIEGQVTALRALRREADINSKEFKELTADIGKYERQLNKAQGRSGGGGARQATQVAGAVISGGIFGGPEGAIGGALGAFGGVQGAFAGAAIGAQVGGLRKSIGAAADYSAQIQKLQIALRGVAGSQENYTSALETAAQVTRSLNVPQQDAVRGVTRLTAAVTGAGGPLKDAETTFKNVTAAIKATGGNTEDVKGAITAMVQVFSKGKVSAEELSGQLGERLPGAVTLFAKANKMTLPELQKNLKAGAVGLNELMAFIEELGVKYSGTAQKIASSNAEAGARLTVAFDEMRASVGLALGETGAELQDTFTKFIQDITPSMVKVAKVIAKAMSGLADNLGPALAGLGTFVGIITAAGLISTLANLASGLGLLGVAAQGSATGIGALTASMAINPLFGGALAVAGIVAGIVAVTNALGRQKKELKELAKLKPGQTYASLSNEERLEKISAAKASRETAKKELQDRLGSLYEGQTVEELGTVARNKIVALRKEIAGYDETLKRLTAPVKTGSKKPFKYDLVTEEDDGSTGGGTGPKDISEAMANKLIGANNLRRKGVQITKEQILAQQKTAIAAAQSLLPQRQRVELNKIEVKTANEIFALEERDRKEAEQKLIKEREKAVALSEIKLITGEITQEEFDQQEIRQQAFELTKLFPEQLERVQAALEEAASPLGKFKKGLKELFESAMDLKTALGEFAVQAVDSFGDAFADFVTTGKANFADFTASILRDLAKIFARAALFKTLSMIPGVGNFLGLADGGGD